MRAALILITVLLAACATGVSTTPPDGTTAPSDGTSVVDAEGGGVRPDGKPSGSCGGKSCDDKLWCTNDSCVAGQCVSSVSTGSCLIAGACHAAAAKKAGSQCQVCQPSASHSAWTDDAARCADDGLSCTTASCSQGVCSHALQSGYCAVAGACVKDKAPDPQNACRACDAAKSTTSFSDRPDGAACTQDTYGCTDDLCKGGACTHPVKAGKCLIGGVCHDQNVKNTANPCQACLPASSTGAWSPVTDGTLCTGGKCLGGTCCKGCVKGGSCLPGTTTADCGVAGAACVTCQGSATCSGGTCSGGSPLTLDIGTYGQTYSDASHSRGYWFTAPIDFTIVGLRVPTDIGTAVQNVEVLRLNAVPDTSSYTSLFYKSGVAGTGFITTSVAIKKGEIVGVLGTRGTTTMYNSYASAYTYSTTIGGQAVTLLRLMMQSNLYQGKSTGTLMTNSHYYGRVELQYLPK